MEDHILAPIGLSVYTRLGHLRQVVSALKKNDLSKKSELYIFSDAPKIGDEDKVSAMRSFLSSVDGFCSVHLIFRKKNDRVFNNRDGIRMLLERYGKMIFLEEDIVPAPGFLRYMNEALEFYKNDSQVISITGYAPPINAYKYIQSDVFALRRFSGWGIGLWKEKYDIAMHEIASTEYKKYLQNTKNIRGLNEYGEDIYNMVKLDLAGDIDALDVKFMLLQAVNEWYTVYPKHSLVENIGHDGTGIHCGETDKFSVNQLWSKESHFLFAEKITPNKDIVRLNSQFRKKTFRTKLIEFLQALGLYPHLKKIQKKINK